MARDYARRTRTKTTPSAQRRTGNRNRNDQAGAPGWAWALAGLALGLFVAFLVYLNENRPPAPASTAANQRSTAPKPAAPDGDQQRPRFDFYTILPEQEVVVPENPQEDERAAQERGQAQYLLQAGSFRTLEQADTLRARLALLGVEASIETVRMKEGDTWHRVRVGPFNSVRAIAKIQERLRRQEIQTLRVKIKG